MFKSKLASTFLILFALGPLAAEANVRAYFNQNQSAQYVEPYRNITRSGDNLEQVVLDEIKAAKKTIFLAVQELRLPLIASALIQKKAEGVDVRVILEHDYNFTILDQSETSEQGEYEASKLTELRAFVDVDRNGRIDQTELLSRDAIYMLRSAGVPVIDDTFDSSEKGAGLMHHKFLVVDGKSTVVSSANLTMSCVHGDMLTAASRGNSNSMVQVESVPFAKIFFDEFLQMWGNGKRGNFGHNKTYRGPQTVSVRGTQLTVQFSPTSQRYNWSESTNGLIGAHLESARSSVKGLLFVFSDQRLADVLEDRSDRGVAMGFIIEPKFAYREYSEILDMMGVQLLSQKCTYENNNRPWSRPVQEVGMSRLNSGDVLHHKFAVIDNTKVVVGSQNWSDAANFTNDETLIVIENSNIAGQYSNEYNRVKATSLLGIPASLRAEIESRKKACNL
jgi:phosphatidylserine/phosphatidylglycerophosphate/cardiolipin synthase-like enzyme